MVQEGLLLPSGDSCSYTCICTVLLYMLQSSTKIVRSRTSLALSSAYCCVYRNLPVSPDAPRSRQYHWQVDMLILMMHDYNLCLLVFDLRV
jgi:hypothetical protein